MRKSIIWLPVRKLTVCAKVQLKEGQREGSGLIKSLFLFLSPLKGHGKGGQFWVGCFIYFTVWWVDLVWLPDAHLVAFLLPLLMRAVEKIRWSNSWVMIRTGRSLTSYHCGENGLDLGEINLFYCQLKIE